MNVGEGSGRGSELLAVVLAAGAAGTHGESLSDAGGIPCVDIDPQAWPVVMRAARDAGGRLDWLGAVDVADRHPQTVDVVAEVLTEQASVLVRTQVPIDGALPSVRGVFAAAAWHEREVSEFFGLRFEGGDDRPLLLADRGEEPNGRLPDTPLLRRTPLLARLDRPWPGARSGADARPGRRRARVPGVPAEWRTP